MFAHPYMLCVAGGAGAAAARNSREAEGRNRELEGTHITWEFSGAFFIDTESNVHACACMYSRHLNNPYRYFLHMYPCKRFNLYV